MNYLFRHTWEYWWPLYPAVIVAISVFGMETWRFIAAQFMYTPVALLTGYFFLLRPHRTALALQPDVPAGAQGRALFLALPLAIIVGASCVLPVVLRTVLPGMDPENRKMLAMLIGLAGALALIAVDERKEGNRRTFRAIIEKRSLGVIFTVGGVMIFKSMLDRSGLLPAASGELIRSGIPVAVAVATLPFLAGLVTGLGIGFTGTSFPLVVGLLNTTGSGLTPMATLVLAFGFGYVGMMLSPVHLCLVATREYFTSTLGGVYRLIAPPLLLIAVFAVLMHALFIFLGW